METKRTDHAKFVQKIKKSEKDFEEGRFKTVKTEDLWKLG